MDKKLIKIAVGVGLVFGIWGVILYHTHRQKSDSKNTGVPEAVSSPVTSASLAPVQTQVQNDNELNKADVKNTTSVPAVSEKSSTASKSKEKAEAEDCEVVNAPKKDEFMDGVLADVEDDSGVVWWTSDKDDDASESVAFERESKAFRTIASEIAESENEKSKVAVAKLKKKPCVAKKKL